MVLCWAWLLLLPKCRPSAVEQNKAFELLSGEGYSNELQLWSAGSKELEGSPSGEFQVKSFGAFTSSVLVSRT